MEGETVRILKVDAFTSSAFAGNPAGVVLDAEDLSDKQMQKVAAEVQASETAFVVGEEPGRFRVRYFTPRAEVDFCGHASIAVLSALAWHGRIQIEDEPVEVALSVKAGELPVEVRPHPVCKVEVVLTGAEPRFSSFGYSLDLLCGILGIDRYQLPEHWPLGFASVGAWTLVVPVTTKEDLNAARPDFTSLAQLLEKVGATVAMLYTWQGPVDLYCRGFAPGVGIPEDPVTGTGIAAVSALVVREGAVETTPPLTKLCAEQGTHLGRPGHVPVEVVHSDKGVDRVRLAGTAVQVMEGKMRLPTV
jgi:PhzF family phenazine biosynthesis protein